MTDRAAEVLETGRLLSLRRRPAIPRNAGDCIHVGEHSDTAFEVLTRFLSTRSEAELTLLANGMAALASVIIEHILRQLLLAFV